eukprot:12272746-Heterocapsa_arctica.AAC.1
MPRHPKIDLDAFIDNMQLAGQGKDDPLVTNLIEAALDLSQVIEQTLGSPISLPKAALVTSSSEVSKR